MTPAALAALHRAAFDFPRPWSADEFAALLREASTVAVFRDHGFALGRAVADEAELLTIAVLPAARRGGIGAELLGALHAALLVRGVSCCLLEVAADNAAARALYARFGYAEVGRRHGYYQPLERSPVDALVLRAPLGVHIAQTP